MPIFEFECQDCKEIFEKTLKSYKDLEGVDFPCPKCQSRNTTKIMSKTGAFFIYGYNSGNKYSKKQKEFR